jgi:hypothetical protein
MHFSSRLALVAFAMTMVSLGAPPAMAGDDGSAPIWVGIGSLFGWGKEDKDPIEYREHGKIVLPPKMDLPPPADPSAAKEDAWPVNQEVQRKRMEKEAAKNVIAGQGDARLRYTHPFDPNTPVTIRATDPQGAPANCADGKCEPSTLSNLNPLNWVGMGKHTPLGPEPDREWLTDPPKGYRAPAAVAPTDQAAR